MSPIDGPGPAHARPSANPSRCAIYALLVLTAVNSVAYLGRQITPILLQPIKLDLELTDIELGFLSGVTFALFYATLGVPIALLAGPHQPPQSSPA